MHLLPIEFVVTPCLGDRRRVLPAADDASGSPSHVIHLSHGLLRESLQMRSRMFGKHNRDELHGKLHQRVPHVRNALRTCVCALEWMHIHTATVFAMQQNCVR